MDSAAAAAKTAAPMGLDLALEAEPNPDNALDIKAVEEEVVEEELAAEDTAWAAVVVLLAVVVVAVAAAAAEAVNYTREYGLLIFFAHQKYRCWKQTITGNCHLWKNLSNRVKLDQMFVPGLSNIRREMRE